MSLYPQEISMIVSSSPDNGAVNRSADGSAFEIQFNGDALAIPAEAINVNVKVEESTIWWTIPNIELDTNDKLYITGPAEATTTSSIDLGFSIVDQFSMLNGLTTALITMTNVFGIDPPMPVGELIVGDFIIMDTGSLTGRSYEIVNITLDTTSSKLIEVIPSSDSLTNGVYGWSRYRLGATTPYTITIPVGLYDLTGLNNTIQRELETAGAKTDPSPLISLSGDDATQRVEIRFNYDTVEVDMTQSDTFAAIIGADAVVYGPYLAAPIDILMPNIAAFNTVNYFLIQSDLVQRGIRFNNVFNQTIAQVLIDVSPGSQIVSKPYNPAKVNAQELAGAKRSNLRFRLTDDSGQPVNTNSEYWSARIVIDYLLPYVHKS